MGQTQTKQDESQGNKRNTFDEIVQESTEKGLHPYITLTENTTLVRNFIEGKWEKINTSVDISGIGDVAHKAELDDLRKAFQEKGSKQQNNYDNSYTNFQFSYRLNKGDDLPKFDNIPTLRGEKASLEHIPGEVLLIDIWHSEQRSQHDMQEYQDMLMTYGGAWGDKFRMVAVSVDDDKTPLRNRISIAGWGRMQHLTLGSWRQHQMIKMLEVKGIPFFCLVDSEGKIDFVGHPSGIGVLLRARINGLVDKAKNIAARVPGECWQKFLAAVKNLPNVAGLQCVGISSARKRQLKNGKVTETCEPLLIKYTSSKQNAAAHDDFVKQLTASFAPNEFKVKPFIDDPQFQQQAHLKKVSEILKKHGINKDPLLRETRTLDIKMDKNYRVSK